MDIGANTLENQQKESVEAKCSKVGEELFLSELENPNYSEFPRRSKRIIKPKSFDDSEVFVSTAELRIRHASRSQIQRSVSDIAENFERGQSFSLNKAISKHSNDNTRRSESCPRLLLKGDRPENSCSPEKTDRSRTRRKNKRQAGDGKLVNTFLDNYFGRRLSQEGKTNMPNEDNGGDTTSHTSEKTNNADDANNIKVSFKPETRGKKNRDANSVNALPQKVTPVSINKDGNSDNLDSTESLPDTHNKSDNSETMSRKNVTMLDLYDMISGLTTTAKNTENSIKEMQKNFKDEMTSTSARLTKLEEDFSVTNTKLTELEQKSTETPTIQVSNTIQQVEMLTHNIDNIDSNVEVIMDELKGCKEKMESLTEVVSLQSTRIQELQSEIVDLQTRSMKYNIIINGIKRLKKDENCIALVTKFCTKLLKIPTPIEIVVAHRLGQTLYSPIVARLAKAEHKTLIFEHVSNLKGKKNSTGSFYRVSDQLPGSRKEKDRRRRDILRNNNKLGPSEKLELSTAKGVIYRKDGNIMVKYESKIVCPIVY